MVTAKAWEIVRLEQQRIPEAITILTRAFMADPVFSFYFPSAETRTEVFRAFLDDLLYSHHRFGHVYGALTAGKIVGVAVWRPPDAGAPTASDRERTLAAEQRIRELDERAAEDLLAGFAALEELHPREPHWYLFFIGIEPELQGRGIGSDLLSPVLEIADRSQVRCYLETPFPQTHEFYKALGFAIVRETNTFRGAPKVWAMSRSSPQH